VHIIRRNEIDRRAVAYAGKARKIPDTAKWGVQIAGMIFQTGSRTSGMPIIFKQWQRAGNI